MLGSDAPALLPSLRVPRREHAAKEVIKEASVEATSKFMPISSLSGSGIGSNCLEQQTVVKTTAHCCSSIPPSA